MKNITTLRVPADPEQMNNRRSKWAMETLNFFADNVGEKIPPGVPSEHRDAMLRQNLADLLANFAHLCDRTGIDMRGPLDRAAAMYREETDDEGLQLGT
jgi:hypothetical protein